MQKITNIVSSVTYYRRKNIIFVIIYSGALFALSATKLLMLSQEAKIRHLKERWSFFSTLLPNDANSDFGVVMTADAHLQARYQLFSILIIALVFVLVTGLTGSLVFKHRKDILTLLSLGIKKSKITRQLIMDSLLPIFFSVILTTTLLLIFQSPLRHFITTTNDYYFANELPRDFNELGRHPLITNKQTPELSEKVGELVLPVDGQLFYHNDSLNDSFSYASLLNISCQTFLGLLLFSCILTSPILYCAVQLTASKIQ